jgi:hypothetical protein
VDCGSTALLAYLSIGDPGSRGYLGGDGVALRHQITANLPPLCTDRSRFRKILLILLPNALKFPPPRETVTSVACDGQRWAVVPKHG